MEIKEEIVFFPSMDFQLEGLLAIQEAFPIKGGLILCHPHSLYGGNMHNHVIQVASEVAWEEGFSTLRFNFRGVGRSGGSYDDGIGERKDVEAAIQFFKYKMNDPNLPLLFLGYSFGAWVGIPIAAREEKIQGLVIISPPLQLLDFNFLKGCQKKKLIVVGTQDLWCPKSQLDLWYQELEDPKYLNLIQGADHFFFSHVQYLKEPIRIFLKKF
ncbi:MAG: alpha/beta hydrolase [Thermodesulfobacteriota bacterium]